MGAIWNNVSKEHTIKIDGKVVGIFNAISRITASPMPVATLENTLNVLYRNVTRKSDRKVTFHIFDKASGEYALCIHDSSIKLPDKWWENNG